MRLSPERLEAAARTLIAATGAPAGHASAVAESLVAADLRGHGSHGVIRVPLYAEKVETGALDPTAEPTLEHDGGATLLLDGRNTYGQVVGREAVSLLGERAAEHGVAAVGIRDATHLGRVGEWGERVADAGLCFAAFVNSQSGGYNVAPAGSADRLLSTNPLCFGVPTFGALPHDVVLDMATSQVAHGKVREQAWIGNEIPEGWAVDDDGRPYTDAAEFEEGVVGAQLPLGGTVSGYKGTGLAVVADLFAGIFGDGAVAGEREAVESNNAALFVAVDPLRFTTRDGVERRVRALSAHLDSADYESGPSPGAAAAGDRFVMPGRPEYDALQASREGVEVDDAVVDRLRGVAETYGAQVDL
ncbi:MAG: Ldh family oxidoreductase [Haloferacaceae archaeon]